MSLEHMRTLVDEYEAAYPVTWESAERYKRAQAALAAGGATFVKDFEKLTRAYEELLTEVRDLKRTAISSLQLSTCQNCKKTWVKKNKHCPFCGGEDLRLQPGRPVVCNKCLAQGPEPAQPETATDGWNWRVRQTAERDAAIERAEAAEALVRDLSQVMETHDESCQYGIGVGYSDVAGCTCRLAEYLPEGERG